MKTYYKDFNKCLGLLKKLWVKRGPYDSDVMEVEAELKDAIGNAKKMRGVALLLMLVCVPPEATSEATSEPEIVAEVQEITKKDD